MNMYIMVSMVATYDGLPFFLYYWRQWTRTRTGGTVSEAQHRWPADGE